MRNTDPGLGTVTAEVASQDPVPPSDDIPEDTPPPPAFDSWIPAGNAEPASGPTEPTVRKPTPMRRGPAPLYEGRSAAVPDGASVEWVTAPAEPEIEVPPPPRRP